MQKIWRPLVTVIFTLTVLISMGLSAVPTVAMAASGSFPGCPVLAQGSQGPCVELLQEDLRWWSNLSIDGDFGPLTHQVTVDFQRLYGLVPDGVVGPKTATTLSDVNNPLLVAPPSTGTPANHPPSFNPDAAAAWAVQNPTTPAQHPGDPCTEFVSKTLANGGLPYSGSWYPDTDAVDMYINSGQSSLQWDNATAMKNYVVGQGWASIIPLNLYDPTSALMARPGDLVYYQWYGTDAHVHMGIVTGMSGDVPLITEQTGDQRIPYAVNEPWNLSHVNGDQLLGPLYPSAQAYLLHWQETPV